MERGWGICVQGALCKGDGALVFKVHFGKKMGHLRPRSTFERRWGICVLGVLWKGGGDFVSKVHFEKVELSNMYSKYNNCLVVKAMSSFQSHFLNFYFIHPNSLIGQEVCRDPATIHLEVQR